MRSLMLFSTSTVHGTAYMEYAIPYLLDFLGPVRSILFVPYARPGGIAPAAYTQMFRDSVGPAGLDVLGIDEATDAIEAIETAESVFVGGGNTFVLLRELHESGLLEAIRQRVDDGMPYLGSSAGSNVAGLSIGTTNDMPIVEPPGFAALRLVPFNINPHYLDPDPGSTHMGETRETRIREFHAFNSQPVVGLREGALLRVGDTAVELHGTSGGRLFRRDRDAEELEPGARLDFLLRQS